MNALVGILGNIDEELPVLEITDADFAFLQTPLRRSTRKARTPKPSAWEARTNPRRVQMSTPRDVSRIKARQYRASARAKLEALLKRSEMLAVVNLSLRKEGAALRRRLVRLKTRVLRSGLPE